MKKTIYATLEIPKNTKEYLKYMEGKGYKFDCNFFGDEWEVGVIIKKSVGKEDFIKEIQFLREEGVTSVSDENQDEFVINFYSPEENYPKGICTDEGWRDFIYEV